MCIGGPLIDEEQQGRRDSKVHDARKAIANIVLIGAGWWTQGRELGDFEFTFDPEESIHLSNFFVEQREREK
eukprot:scaffold32258_cov61-Cyclotella_meneghiniana.AAC.2